MTEIYAFIFCLGLGIAARLLYMAASALAEKTDIFPVTVVLDISVTAFVGGAFAAYVILSSAVIAPYMFAALAAGYLITFMLTRNATAKKRTN
ncbi:MAG: hypothetical protein J1G04_02675 [Clostridiales bacterium]|nr:hypothetical protein [Clostridiales bacterium]